MFWIRSSKELHRVHGKPVARKGDPVLEMRVSDMKAIAYPLTMGILGRCGSGKILDVDGHPCPLSLNKDQAASRESYDLASDTIAGPPTSVAYAPLQDIPGKIEGVVQLFFDEDVNVCLRLV